MIDREDGSTSDESVLYQGIWLAADDANQVEVPAEGRHREVGQEWTSEEQDADDRQGREYEAGGHAAPVSVR